MRKPNEQLIDSYDYLANAASAQDLSLIHIFFFISGGGV